MPVRRVAVEEAFVTREIVDAWAKQLQAAPVEPGFLKMAQSILAPGPQTAAVHARLLDLGAGRIEQMDRDGVALQLLSLTAPGVQVFDADSARALAADANDRLAAAVQAHPTRFAGLAAIAPQHPASAAREIERAVTRLGLKGVIVNSHTRGEYLDAPHCWEIFAACEALRVPLYLHPREPSPQMVAPFLDYGLYFAGWGFAAEAGLHAMRLIMSGLFKRFPGLTIILGHMGEGIPFWLRRIDNRYQLQARIGAVPPLERLPSDYFRDNFLITTSGVTDADVFQLCLKALGAERILFAADYPYESAAEAVEAMDSHELAPHQRLAIYSGNSERVFRLGC